jgi:hypothetical protein
MMGMGKQFDHPKVLLQTNVMYGVDGPFVGDNSPIRGEVGDDLPWEPPSSVIARLMTDGRVFIAVRGLVLGFDDVVPENMRGVNPDDTFRGMVSCLTEDGDMSKEVNVRTRPFKADAKGNSLIFDKVELPNPCVAPILFVIDGDEDVWFAVTGAEQED